MFENLQYLLYKCGEPLAHSSWGGTSRWPPSATTGGSAAQRSALPVHKREFIRWECSSEVSTPCTQERGYQVGVQLRVQHSLYTRERLSGGSAAQRSALPVHRREAIRWDCSSEVCTPCTQERGYQVGVQLRGLH